MSFAPTPHAIALLESRRQAALALANDLTIALERLRLATPGRTAPLWSCSCRPRPFTQYHNYVAHMDARHPGTPLQPRVELRSVPT